MLLVKFPVSPFGQGSLCDFADVAMLQSFPPEALVPVCAHGAVLTLTLPVDLGISIWAFVKVTIAVNLFKLFQVVCVQWNKSAFDKM